MRMRILKSRHQKIAFGIDLTIPDHDLVPGKDMRQILAIPNIANLIALDPQFPFFDLKAMSLPRQEHLCIVKTYIHSPKYPFSYFIGSLNPHRIRPYLPASCI